MELDLNAAFELLRKHGVKSFKGHPLEGPFIEVEFFPEVSEPMHLDPVSLSKALSDSMPPDSAMLFASTEDMNENLTPEQRENNDMT